VTQVTARSPILRYAFAGENMLSETRFRQTSGKLEAYPYS